MRTGKTQRSRGTGSADEQRLPFPSRWIPRYHAKWCSRRYTPVIMDAFTKEVMIEQAESDTWTPTMRAVPTTDGNLLQGSPVGENVYQAKDASNSLAGGLQSPIKIPSSVSAKKCTTRKYAQSQSRSPRGIPQKKTRHCQSSSM